MTRNSTIVKLLRIHGASATSFIHRAFGQSGDGASLVTVRRELQKLVLAGVLATKGAGRSLVYELTPYGKLTDNVEVQLYCELDPDARYGAQSYVLNLLESLTFNPFSASQQETLKQATGYYQEKNQDLSRVIQNKELERFVIELSWKSSKIEGNTYTLLDTEKLLLEAKEAPGHDHREAQMILNHKSAFEYIRRHAEQFQKLRRGHLEDVHKLLLVNLGVTYNLRKKPVGVTGSRYRPLDNEYQISEAIETLIAVINRCPDPYAKALFVLIGLSYIQPFEDGNKRTARLMANAVLLAHQLAPLSYRSVTEEAYRGATLVFYELNSLIPFRDIFVEQYDFAARNYLVKGG